VTFDVDHFKEVNDTYGHPAGDYVLAEMSLAVQAIVRVEDVFARVGGEEFSIICRGADIAQGRVIAERVRHAVSSHSFVFAGKNIPITVSAGVAAIQDARIVDARGSWQRRTMPCTRPSAQDAIASVCGGRRPVREARWSTVEKTCTVTGGRPMSSFSSLDPQIAIYMIVALVLNLLIILWAVARLSHDLRLLKLRNSMLEDSINLLDQGISNLTLEFQTIRQIENRKAGLLDKPSAPQTAKAP